MHLPAIVEALTAELANFQVDHEKIGQNVNVNVQAFTLQSICAGSQNHPYTIVGNGIPPISGVFFLHHAIWKPGHVSSGEITQDSKTTSHGKLPGLDGYLCLWRLSGHGHRAAAPKKTDPKGGPAELDDGNSRKDGR